MKLRKRITILVTLFIVFFIAAPLIIIVATGHRFDITQRRFVETGALIVNSEPRGASVFLDNEEQAQTPATMRFLLPGEYLVRLELEDYQPWEARVKIFPEQISRISPENGKLTLFLKVPKKTQRPEQTLDFGFTPNGLVSWNATSTLEFSVNSGQKIYTGLPYSEDFPPQIEIDPNFEWAFIKSLRDYSAVNLSTTEITELSSYLTGILRAQALDTNTLAIQTENGGLYILNTAIGQINLIELNVARFVARAGVIYFIDSQGLKLYRPENAQTSLVVAIPQASSAEIFPSSSPELTFLLLDNALYQAQENRLLPIETNIARVHGFEPSEIVALSNDHSLWLYDPRKNEDTELLFRSQEKISNVQIRPSAGSVFYLQNGKIMAVETTSLLQKNITQILNEEVPIEKFFVDAAGKNVFYQTADKRMFSAVIR